MKDLQFYLELEDKEWERAGEQKDRHCARAIVVDDEDRFYFVQITRDDLFGLGTYIETAGGGLEENENAEDYNDFNNNSNENNDEYNSYEDKKNYGNWENEDDNSNSLDNNYEDSNYDIEDEEEGE